MSEDRDYGFCPRCGALMQDGVCRSCGYAERNSVRSDMSGNSERPKEVPFTQTQPRKKNRKGLFVVLAVLAAFLLLAALIAAVIFLGKSVGNIMHAAEDSFFDEYGDDGIYDDGFYDDFGSYDGEYIPDADDPYYREITDCTRTDLEYGISWITDSITPDSEEDYCTYYAVYPRLDGEGEQFETINSAITRKALEYKENYRSYPGGCSSYGYVTYMDEERISIVFQHELYEENGTLPRVTALTFSLENGQEILPEQMTELNEELVMRFRAQNKVQNGDVKYVEESSDEELLAQFQDPDKAFFFYSPVGLEAGVNYESEEFGSGWVSVTLKDQAL